MTDLDRYSQDLGFRLDRWQILGRLGARVADEPLTVESGSAELWRQEVSRLRRILESWSDAKRRAGPSAPSGS